MKSLSHVQLFATPWTVAYQAPPSMGFSRQEYWSGLPFPSPGDLPDLGMEPRSPALEADALTSEPLGKPKTSLERMKGQAMDWGKLFTNHIFHKGVVSRIHKELSKLNHKETSNLITIRWLSSKESAYRCKKCRFHRLVGKTPEEEMATHCSVPAWEIPWTEKPGGLQSIRSQKSRTQQGK